MAPHSHQHYHPHSHHLPANQAHNTFQANVFAGPNLSYGPPPVQQQHAQLTSNNFPVQPPPPHLPAHAPGLLPSAMPPPPPPQPARHTLDPNGIYDGLTYRSTLLGHKLPPAPPPEKEWSVQSEKCIAFLRSHLATSKKDLAATKADKTNPKGDHANANPVNAATQSQPVSSADLAPIDALERTFHDLATAGAAFSRTMRIYQYRRSGCGKVTDEQGHAVWIAQDLTRAWRAMRKASAHVGGMLSSVRQTDTAATTRKRKNEIDKVQASHRAFAALLADPLAIEAITLALKYIDHYMKPYEDAMACLDLNFQTVAKSSLSEENQSAKLGEWLMYADDGDSRRLRRRG